MLSRSAEDLYWMSRYVERAENTARVLDVSYRMGLLPGGARDETDLWGAAIAIGPSPEAFHERYETTSADNVMRYMALDPENPSSIYSAIQAARENARAQRAIATSEMWESLNATWLEIKDLDYAALKKRGFRAFFEWIKERSHLFRGVTYGTMLREDAFHFMRLGTFIERGDSTSRMLDVKYHVLLPSVEHVGGAADYYQWGAVLRSLASFTAYRKVYRGEITPTRIAELLILREDAPRSLHFCITNVTETLATLAPARSLECQRIAGRIHADLRYRKIGEIFETGLHEFLEDFIARNGQLGGQIQSDFLMTPVVELAG